MFSRLSPALNFFAAPGHLSCDERNRRGEQHRTGLRTDARGAEPDWRRSGVRGIAADVFTALAVLRQQDAARTTRERGRFAPGNLAERLPRAAQTERRRRLSRLAFSHRTRPCLP